MGIDRGAKRAGVRQERERREKDPGKVDFLPFFYFLTLFVDVVYLKCRAIKPYTIKGADMQGLIRKEVSLKKREVGKNYGSWTDESKGIIGSNGELEPDYKKYKINCELHISPNDDMTPAELRQIAYYCESISASYRANEQYIR